MNLWSTTILTTRVGALIAFGLCAFTHMHGGLHITEFLADNGGSQLDSDGDAPVFSRCVDDEKTARWELNGRKPPPVQGLLFVGEVKAIEVNALRAGIENLDPVRGVAITVQLRATIVR